MSDSSDKNENSGQTEHTLVDRAVVAVFAKDTDSTPSSPQHVSASIERLHRLHGTALILSAIELLKLNASTYATACTVFHRFFHRVSLNEHDVWSISMAATLLACKIEEEPRPIRQIIVVYSHLYRRCRLVCCEDDKVADVLKHPSVRAVPRARQLTLEEKQTVLRHVQPLSPLGPLYQDWYKALVEAEQTILRQLGFTVYWIPDSHPHKFILHFVRVLEIDNQEFSQEAWKYCNDSCRLDLCVRFEPELIACAAIHMAAVEISLPRSWWDVFVGTESAQGLSTICNLLSGLTLEHDVLIANVAFLPSLSGESFNDPESFLWAASGAEAKTSLTEKLSP